MATSGSSNFSTTKALIIRDSLLLLGVIDSNQGPKAEDMADSGRMLDMLVKYLQTQVKIWPLYDIVLTLTPGTMSYDVDTGVLDSEEGGTALTEAKRFPRIIAARRRNATGDISVRVVDRDEYMGIPIKSTQAPVNIVYYDPQISNAKVYVWPTGQGTTDITLILTVQRTLEDFDAVDNTPDFPQEWYLFLVYKLASLLALSYNKQDKLTALTLMASDMLKTLRGFDNESTSIRFQPAKTR